jgi:hypothetical protein
LKIFVGSCGSLKRFTAILPENILLEPKVMN